MKFVFRTFLSKSGLFAAAPEGKTDCNNIVYVNGTLTVSDHPSSGGPSAETYDITVVEPLNGKVTVKDKAEVGTTVTVVVTPDKGYEVKGIRAAYLGSNGRTNTLGYKKGAAANSFTFVMPKADVIIYAEITGGTDFVDIKPDAYYYDAVLWAVEKGITKGTSETKFRPNDNCTRGQIVTFIYRQIGK